jgi:hypothetical protein
LRLIREVFVALLEVFVPDVREAKVLDIDQRGEWVGPLWRAAAKRGGH